MKKPGRKIPTTKAERQAFYKEVDDTIKKVNDLVKDVKEKAAKKKQ